LFRWFLCAHPGVPALHRAMSLSMAAPAGGQSIGVIVPLVPCSFA
jgi:hypothetical protein